MDVDEMAGRELDAAIWMILNDQKVQLCEQGVFGCRYVDGDVQPHAGYPIGHISPPRYASDLVLAFNVVNAMMSVPYSYEFYLCQQGRGWDVSFQHPGDRGGQARGPTVPIAICRAAIQAVLNSEMV